MISIFIWYLTVQCLGVVGFAFGSRICAGLPDRGYCASKMLGVLLTGLVLWLGTGTGLLRNGPGGAMLALLALLVLAVAWRLEEARHDLLTWVREHRSLVIAAETLFLVAFLAWCFVRAHDPAADHTEEPMDLMLLVAVSSSDRFPPADPWLSGYPISYYYLGYWLMATVGHLAGTRPEVTYNLAQATWFGLLLLGCFGLAFDLTALSRRKPPASGVAVDDDDDRSETPLRAGLLAALVVGLTANIALPLEWARRWLDGTAATLWTENWWWWRSSRVVHDVGIKGDAVEVITEFPFFSYLLGDNHPHVLAMPVVVTTLTLALAVFVGERKTRSSGAGRGLFPGGVLGAVVILAVAGSIAAINTWDLPAAWSILALAAAAAAARVAARPWRAALRGALTAGALIVLATVVLYLPYHLTASSQVQGLLPNLLHPTALSQVLLMFATLLPGVGLLVLEGWESAGARAGRALRIWLVLLGAALVWLAVAGALLTWGGAWSEWPGAPAEPLPGGLARLGLSRWTTGWPTLAVATAALAIVLEALRARWARTRGATEQGVTFALALAAAGFALIVVPEVVYLHDSFGTRMNTVFKFYYQAWLLLGIAAAIGLTSSWRRGGGARAAALAGICVLALGLFYPVMGLWTKTGGFATEPTLDALAWIERWRPDEMAAIRWVRRFTPPDAVVVQRSGASYRAEHNLVSMATGRPTLLGWGGHEYQWRGEAFGSLVAGREEALGRIYSSAAGAELEKDLTTWGVGYVWVGPEERDKYGMTPDREHVLATAMDLVFENPTVRIYRRRG